MIAKCIALLAVVAQINAYVCNANCGRPVVTSGAVATGCGVNSRNYVAKGRYPVALDNPGPCPDPRIPVTSSHVQAPVQEKPTVRLASPIPCPRTVAHTCTCYKTILRPRVHDQLITVPSIQRYIETTHTPVVENIHYEGVPVNTGCGCGCGCGCGTVPPVGAAGCGCGAVSSVGACGCGAVTPVSACGCGCGAVTPVSACGCGCAPVASYAAAIPVGVCSTGCCC